MPTNPPLTAEAVRAALPLGTTAPDILVFDTLDSTNTEAKRMARACLDSGTSLPRPTLIIARSQTAGRGRMGRDFYSPAHTGLYMTLLYATDRPLTDAVAMTGAAAVAVATVLEDLTGESFLIKWVNDIYRRGCKVCGILTEAISGEGGLPHHIAVGIGINVTTEAFPDGLRAPAASVASVTDGRAPFDINALAARVAATLLALVEDPAAPAVVDAYRARSMLTLTPTPVTVFRGAEVYDAVAEGIGEDYALHIRRPDGRVEVLSGGEVSVRAKAGQ